MPNNRDLHLHIICLTIPYPVDFGGVFDLFYKLPALQAQGVKIHLHCFEYGRTQQEELKKYCYSVNYYERPAGHKSVSLKLPYIVTSRKNETLFQTLLQDEYPIFMEGIHCTYLLNDNRFANRRKYVRIHNVEYQYYSDLSRAATSWFRKLYYRISSYQLQQYEQAIVTKATAFWGVTHNDVAVYRNEFKCTTIDFLPLYLPPEWQVNSQEGMGNYCLYQADLSVDANEKAAIWLLEQVFSKIDTPLVIAGKNPSKKLQETVYRYLNTCIIANPSQREMQDMIAKAHINILPSFHSTGIKLKLLNALYNGRHCLVNPATVMGSGLESLCHIATTNNSFIEKIQQLHVSAFSDEAIVHRKQMLSHMFNNEANAKQQLEWIWNIPKNS